MTTILMLTNQLGKFLRPYASITNNQALRYAIACTLATVLAGLLSRWLQLPTPLFLSLILSSALLIYFSYGNTLLIQTLMITIGTITAYLLCSVAIYIAPLTIICFIFLVIVSLIGYFYSTINTGCLFITKLNIVLISFAITGMFTNNAHTTQHAGLMILLGGGIALVVNAAIYGLAQLITSKNLLTDWHNALCEQLAQLANGHLPENFEKIMQEFNQYKLEASSYQLTTCLLADQISNALLKYVKLVKHKPIITPTFSKPIQQLFSELFNGLSNSNHHDVIAALTHFNDFIISIKQDGFFKDLPISIRKSYTECFFLVNKLTNNLARYIAQKSHQTRRHPSKEPIIKQTMQAIKQQKIFHHHQLTIESKIAIRAGIAIPLSYAIAIFFNITNPSWVILTTNLVLLVRKGDTIKKSIDRMLGHCFGALLTLPFAYHVWINFSSTYFWTPLLALTTAYCFLKNYFIYSMMLMLLLVYLYGLTNSTGFIGLPAGSYILTRLIAVIIGCMIAMLAGLFIFPNTGITPLMTAHPDIFNEFYNCLQALKYKKGETPPQDLNFYKTLTPQLEHNIAIYKSLSFQPDQYNYHKKTQHILIQLEIELTEDLSSLSRRMVGIESSLLLTPLLYNQINQCLDNTINMIKHVSTLISSLANKERIMLPNKTTSLINSLHIQIEAIITEAFHMSDNNKINYFEFINYLGVLYAIQKLNRTVQQTISPTPT